MKKSIQLIAGLSLLAVLGGCGETQVPSRLTQAPTGSVPNDLKALPPVAAEAGYDLIPAAATTTDVVTIAKGMSFSSRGNDFALMSGEQAFDMEQRMLNLFEGGGGFFNAEFATPEERPVSEELRRVEIPMWRLSGIVIGESVSALLEKAPGQTVSVRPGMVIDGEWMCVSIDQEKAVFRRLDNAEPNTMEVRLSLPMGGGGGGGGGNRGGAQQGGGPGGTQTPGRGGRGGDEE